MTPIRLAFLLLTTIIVVCFSHFSFSQIVEQTTGIVQQIERIDSVSDRLRGRLEDRLPKSPELDSLPLSNASLITRPLTSLPDSLPIGADIKNPAWTEVRVEDNWRAVKNQWVVFADNNTKSTLTSLGATIESEEEYAGLNLSILHFTVPDALDSKQALTLHLSESSIASLDRNHVYQAQSTRYLETQDRSEQRDAQHLFKSTFCADNLKVGMIDSAVDQAHPLLEHAKITSKSFLTGNVKSPVLHGTAVASVFLGKFTNRSPLLTNAHLYSAEVFYRQSDFAQGATLVAMIEAINWLIEENVMIINMSLAGPDNAMLSSVISAAHQQGAYIVAAAGNEGPAAAAVFPAGYEDVIAVSAIDKNQQAYRWSNQGDYIDFSALGVNVLTAQSQKKVGRESGTSMAAPVVSAALACALHRAMQIPGFNRNAVISELSNAAIDLGPVGKDPIFGIGAIQPR